MHAPDVSFLENGSEAMANAVASIDEALAGISRWKLIVITVCAVIVAQRLQRLWRASERPVHSRIVSAAFSVLRHLPPIRKKIENELEEMRQKIFHEIHKNDRTESFIGELPECGTKTEDIIRIASKSFLFVAS
ncbi:unnamed protein product [Gongylonema pulchrum]|uniref:DUF4220 domain-containing protein n=1 Tax=Gongylonema pulchrum TaxID=637853 RepID=A0A183CV51_9BILA|nr:unnamed protein product [Gongylonema pulchrum]